ncbi:MAG: outer membrane protein assembly factor BamC [Gallionellaceae bacterium]
MKLRNVVGILVAAALFSGCSTIVDSKKNEYKTMTGQSRPLEVPPDLTTPKFDQSNVIPGAEGAASYSEYAQKNTEQPCVAPVSAPPAPAVAAVPKWQEGKAGRHILLSEAFGRSWRRVGLALDRAHIKVADKNRSKGIYYITMPAEKDSKNVLPNYLVTVSEDQGTSEISVTDDKGLSDAKSEHFIEALYAKLNTGSASALSKESK